MHCRYYLICLLAFIFPTTIQAQQRYAHANDSIAEAKVRQVPFVDYLVRDDEYNGAHVRYRYEDHTVIRTTAKPGGQYNYYCIEVSDSGWHRANENYIFLVYPEKWEIKCYDKKTNKTMTLEQWEKKNKPTPLPE